MCRYAFHVYKHHYACFACRKAYKPQDGTRAMHICPSCGGVLHEMGLDFKAPKQSNKSAWKAVQLLHQNGVIFSSCGCGGPGYRPTKPGEVESFLAGEAAHRASEGERLLAKFKARA